LGVRAAKDDALIKNAAIADHGGFTDDHAHAVVDEDASSNACSWMNLYPCEKTVDVG
jgi:hypothetical protein